MSSVRSVSSRRSGSRRRRRRACSRVVGSLRCESIEVRSMDWARLGRSSRVSHNRPRRGGMKTDLLYLTYVTALTGLLWVPYILDRIAVWGLVDTVGYPENPKPQSPWAQRLKKAHANAVENLVV